MTTELYSPGTQLAPLPHLSPLVVAVIAAIVVGRPLGWIGFLLPLGPIATAAGAKLARRNPVPTWRLPLGFSMVCAAIIGGSWGAMRLGESVEWLTLLFPLAVLAFFLGLVNFVLVSVSRSIRAWKSIPLEYPWIPGWLDRPLGLTPTMKEM